jgi:hypothetical protein
MAVGVALKAADLCAEGGSRPALSGCFQAGGEERRKYFKAVA